MSSAQMTVVVYQFTYTTRCFFNLNRLHWPYKIKLIPKLMVLHEAYRLDHLIKMKQAIGLSNKSNTEDLI